MIEQESRIVLARFERAWEFAGAPVCRFARPGLTSVEIDDLVRPLGLRLPLSSALCIASLAWKMLSPPTCTRANWRMKLQTSTTGC